MVVGIPRGSSGSLFRQIPAILYIDFFPGVLVEHF